MKSNLNNPVLVLNRGWQVVRVENVRHSFCKVFKELADFVDHEDYSTYNWDTWYDMFRFHIDDAVDWPCVQVTHNMKLRAPEIVVLTKYNRVPRCDVKMSRKNIFIRDNFRCQYTGKKLKINEGTIDHILPVSRGGKNTWENMVVSSIEVNKKKDNKTPEEAGLVLLKEPKRPSWHPIYTFNREIESYPDSWKKFISMKSFEENQ